MVGWAPTDTGAKVKYQTRTEITIKEATTVEESEEGIKQIGQETQKEYAHIE